MGLLELILDNMEELGCILLNSEIKMLLERGDKLERRIELGIRVFKYSEELLELFDSL